MDTLSLQFPLSSATFSQLLFTNLYYVCSLTTTWMPYSLGCLLYLTGNWVKYTSLSAQAFVLWYKTASPAELPACKQYCSTMFLSPDLLKINNIVGYLNIYYIGNQISDHVQTGKKRGKMTRLWNMVLKYVLGISLVMQCIKKKKNLSTNVGDIGSIPGPGRFHMRQNN